MSIRVLKGILEANHVNTRLVLEKGELVDKVWNLVEVEKRDRERERLIDEREEQEAIRRQEELLEMFRRQQLERDSAASPSNGGAGANEESHWIEMACASSAKTRRRTSRLSIAGMYVQFAPPVSYWFLVDT